MTGEVEVSLEAPVTLELLERYSRFVAKAAPESVLPNNLVRLSLVLANGYSSVLGDDTTFTGPSC